MPHACLSMNPIDAYEWLSTGSDGRSYCPYAYGYSNYARPGYRPWLLKFADVVAHAPDAGPRGTTIGGTGIAVSSRSSYVDIAADYAFWIASAEVQKGLFFTSGGQPGNAVAWEDDAVNAASSDFFRDTRQTLETAWLRPRYNGYMAFQDDGGTIVNRFLAGDADAAKTLADLEAAYRRSRA
jgi:multiple sugar transport system substrate-binding protein